MIEMLPNPKWNKTLINFINYTCGYVLLQANMAKKKKKYMLEKLFNVL